MQNGIARDHITAIARAVIRRGAQRHKQGGIFGAIALLVKQCIERPAVGAIESGGLDIFPDPVKELAGRSFGVHIFNRWCLPSKASSSNTTRVRGPANRGDRLLPIRRCPNDRVASA